jgi:hypothetical protein
MDIIQGLIETGNAGKSGWRIVNNGGVFGVYNNRTSNVSFSVLNNGAIGASSNIPSNIISSYSNINVITNYSSSSSGGGGSSQWTTAGTKIYYNLGNVGIGTIDPAAPLHIYSDTPLLIPTTLPTEISVVGATSTIIGTTERCIQFPYSGSGATKDYTFTTTENLECDILVVGGGGGGAHNHAGGGGGGAVVFIKSVFLNNGSYTIKVGAGGAKGTRSTTNYGGLKGNDTIITLNATDILKAEGGGGGGQGSAVGSIGNGGSGGGGDGYRDGLSVFNNGVVGTGSIKDYNGTTGVLYGNNGGSSYLATSGTYLNIAGCGGGGGGAGQIGSNATKCNVAGNGGNGISSAVINGITYNFVDIFGTTYGTNDDNNNTTRYFGGGGGGGTWNSIGITSAGDTGPTTISGSGGKGGGGAGALQPVASGFDATANTGGGGGGGSYNSIQSPAVDGGNGGSGIIIIRYRKATSNSSARLLLDTTTTGTAIAEFRRGTGADMQNDYRFINDTDGTIKLQIENSTQAFSNLSANLAWFSSNDTIIHKNTTMSGRVGIGTVYHATRSLDVLGSANISGTVSVGGLSVLSSNAIITNSLSSNVSLTISNGFPLPAPPITSSPSAIETGVTGSYVYQVFTYTTETAGAGTRQSLYTLTVGTGGVVCDVLMVGGGGAGGKQIGGGGGGGAVLYGTNISIASGTYQIKVGDGAVAGEVRGKSTEGFGATILGGGCAGNADWAGATLANSGGSGAGGKSVVDTASKNGGTVGSSTKGTILTTATLYNGNAGGAGVTQVGGGAVQSAGGGGTGAVGGVGNSNSGIQTGNGGAGVLVNITGINYYWGGGGGGGGYQSTPTNGGRGGGGAGERNDGGSSLGFGTVGADAYNTPVNMNGGIGSGGGGGGGGYGTATAGKGGSGIIIIRYLSTITSSTIELVRGTTADANRDYKLGNYGGEFKVISSTSGVDTDYIRITTAGAIFNPTGTASWNIGSDRRIKENIERASYDKCYDNINKLELNRFNYVEGFNTVSRDNKQLGFIAQEVYDLFPKAISSHEYNTNTLSIPDLLSIDVSQINYSLYGAVKKLIEINNEKDERIKTLGYQLKTLETFLNIAVDTSSNVVVDTSNILIDTSNIVIDTSNIVLDTSSNISIDTSNISIDTSNIAIDTSNISIDTSNISIDTSNILIDTSNIVIDTSNISIDTSNISIDTSSNIALDTSNIVLDTSSNISIDTSNIAIDTSNIILDTSSNISIDTSNISLDTSNISIDTSSNISIDTSNISIDTSNILIDTSSNISIDTSNIVIDT